MIDKDTYYQRTFLILKKEQKVFEKNFMVETMAFLPVALIMFIKAIKDKVVNMVIKVFHDPDENNRWKCAGMCSM